MTKLFDDNNTINNKEIEINDNEAITKLFDEEPEEVELLREDEENKIQTIDYFSSLKQDIDEFNEKAWNKGEGYKTPNFPMIHEKLEGIDAGLYLFPAESNAGKSAMMTNVLEDLVMHEPNKLFGIYFSLDDSKHEIIPRIIAMREGARISTIAKPNRAKAIIEKNEVDPSEISRLQDELEKREIGIEKLKSDASKLMIVDSNNVRTLKDIEEYIDRVYNYVKAIDPEMNIAIAIDSIKDISLGDSKKTKNEESDDIAKEVKHWTVKYDCPIFSSVHLRKLNGNRRPTLDDLKDSNVLVYEASVIWLLFNDVSKNKQAAKIYQQNPDSPEKQQVIELDWAKNKKSSFKGRTFCYFAPEISRAKECGKQATDRFNALLFEA